jgi:DNA-binding transcriptional ArsR family regulator
MKKEIKILKALANGKRMEILNLLSKEKNLNVAEIAEEIKLHFKSTSKHLQRLAEAGLIIRSQNGFRVEYNLKEKVEKLLDVITKLGTS